MKRHVVIGFADGSRWVSPALSEHDAQTTSSAIGETWARRGAFTIGPIRSYGTESPQAVAGMFGAGTPSTQSTKDLGTIFQHHLIDEIARRLRITEPPEGTVEHRRDALIGHIKARIGADDRVLSTRFDRMAEQRAVAEKAGIVLAKERTAAVAKLREIATLLDAKILVGGTLADQIELIHAAMLRAFDSLQTTAMHSVINLIAGRLHVPSVPDGKPAERVENLLQLIRYKLIQAQK